jgi:hypothetical protein
VTARIRLSPELVAALRGLADMERNLKGVTFDALIELLVCEALRARAERKQAGVR